MTDNRSQMAFRVTRGRRQEFKQAVLSHDPGLGVQHVLEVFVERFVEYTKSAGGNGSKVMSEIVKRAKVLAQEARL